MTTKTYVPCTGWAITVEVLRPSYPEEVRLKDFFAGMGVELMAGSAAEWSDWHVRVSNAQLQRLRDWSAANNIQIGSLREIEREMIFREVKEKT